MATMKEIRTRIKSVAATGQITKAMKMVAASNLRRVQAQMGPLRTYAESSRQILFDLLHAEEEIDNVFVKEKAETGRVLYVMVVGNRGLCGMYNVALVQFAKHIIEQETRNVTLWVIGKWGRDVIANARLAAAETIEDLSDAPTAEESNRIADRIKTCYAEDQVDEVHLLYQSYVSALRQEPKDYLLFPLSLSAQEGKCSGFREYYFEPDKKQLTDMLIGQYADNMIFSVLQEAKCGEHTARMTAMSNANDNIDKLISKLQISYNRARQEAITNEISEIVGGAAALHQEE